MDNSLLLKNLVMAMNRVDWAYYEFAKNSESRENELFVLYAISDGGEYSQQNISKAWMIPKTTVNTVVKNLRERGLAEIVGDGKEKIIRLTAEGKAYSSRLLTSLRRAETEAIEKTIDKFSPDFVEAIEYFAAYFCNSVMRCSNEKC